MLYAEVGPVRARQVLTDLMALLWVWLWVRIGFGLHGLVSALAGPGELVEEAGRDLEGAAAGGGERLSDVPIVGDVLSAPFDAVAAGGRALVDAGVGQQEAVATLALWVGMLVAALPIAMVLIPYARRRLRTAAEAKAAARLRDAPGGQRLLALRALARADLADLAAAYVDDTDSEPGKASPDARLATIELERLGLRSPKADH